MQNVSSFTFGAAVMAATVFAYPSTAQVSNLCTGAAEAFNKRFTTIAGQGPNGELPSDSGLIVHTIHGPGTPPGQPGYLDLAALAALPVDTEKTCGAYLAEGHFLPWCGSNHDPETGGLSDASSWTYIRLDTLIRGAKPGKDDEVVCSDSFDKRYGLIFSNTYLNQSDNLGCMYPLDGDTGNRSNRGCGVTENSGIVHFDAQGSCPVGDSAGAYEADFDTLVTADNGAYASYAGSLICSLPKGAFDTWVDVRQSIDLGHTDWPVNEFVLWNWDSYTVADLADQGVLEGVFYLSGCQRTDVDGDRAVAQAIADLYETWSGVALPVVNLSNAQMRAKSETPFSCQ